MAAGFDNAVAVTGGSTATVTTGSFTIAGATRAAIVYIGTSADRTVSSVTVGGQTGSAIAGTSVVGPASDKLQAWQVIAPDTGSQTATVTLTASVGVLKVIVLTFTGADQATPFINGNNVTNGFATTVSIDITSTSDGMTTTCAANPAGGAYTTTQTERYDGSDGFAADTAVGTGSLINHTWTSSNNWQIAVGANVNAATPITGLRPAICL